MVQAVKKEKNSCLWKVHKTLMQPNDLCNACFELDMYGSTNVHNFKLKTNGVCFGLSTNSRKENWIPYDRTAVFWDDRLVRPTVATAATIHIIFI